VSSIFRPRQLWINNSLGTLDFVLMAAANIGSIEQLKNIRGREAGLVLGIRRIASKPKIWEWFYRAAQLEVSQFLLVDYFRTQIRSGLVGLWLWFYDGHLLPYSGKHQVRSALTPSGGCRFQAVPTWLPAIAVVG
jgi:hypothetical protein